MSGTDSNNTSSSDKSHSISNSDSNTTSDSASHQQVLVIQVTQAHQIVMLHIHSDITFCK